MKTGLGFCVAYTHAGLCRGARAGLLSRRLQKRFSSVLQVLHGKVCMEMHSIRSFPIQAGTEESFVGNGSISRGENSIATMLRALQEWGMT